MAGEIAAENRLAADAARQRALEAENLALRQSLEQRQPKT